ncbi:hypothetical protein ACLEPN_39875, partial [Myxococcus sp. 1LA]
MFRWGLWCALLMALVSPQAQAAAAKRKAAPPPQPGVVVLEVKGDARRRLGMQLESALRATRQVRVGSQKQYQATARKLKAPAGQVLSEPSFARVGPRLKLDAAVTGTLKPTPRIRVVDASLGVLFDAEVKLVRGRLSAADARKVARAIAAAVQEARAPRPSAVADAVR